MGRMKMFVIVGLCFVLVGFNRGDIIPEMRECMQSHGSQQEYIKALEKYCDDGIVRRAMSLLVIKNPYVINTRTERGMTCYTVEGTVVETAHEIPSDITQTYKVCWKNGKVISLEFYGPKKRITGEILPEMLECMRSHGSQKKFATVLKKYCDSNIMRDAMACLVIKNPSVVETEKEGSTICYMVEGTTVETAHEIPSDIIQVYKVCWDKGKVVSLQFFGPKE
jgi:hypothetical protein